MDSLKAPSLQSLLDSDRGSCESLLIDSYQITDLEELDDEEYSLPPVDALPTLESVLSELDSETDGSLLDVGGTPSHSSAELLDAIHTPTHSQSTQVQGSILRHVVLQGVSAQIQSASDRVNAGLATVLAVSDMIAVGTSHGHILCFDSAQKLRWCCTQHNSHGAVSALGFNQDSTRLLAGFAKGHIVMLNTSNSDTLRSLPDYHAPNTAVLHVRWTSPASALCLDSGGSVWSLSFTRRMGIRGCERPRCLFSGARGEVCAVEPLLLEEDHPLKLYSIAAFATLSKVIVVSIKPSLRVIWTQALTGPAQYLPLLAWQLVVIQSADMSRNLDPVLASARGGELFFHQIIVTTGKIRCIPLRHLNLSYSLLALHWLGPRSLACIDTRETLRLLDVRTTKEQEAVEMGTVGMVYGSAYFKGLATGGNVSPAFALAGTHACYNSIASRGSQLLVLGNRGLHAVTVRSWSERLNHLTSTGRWSEAFNLSLEGYRAAYDRPRRQTMVRDRIIQLFNDYVNKTYDTPEIALADAMKCCVDINQQDLLWGELWDRLSDTSNLYITLITYHIEQGALTILAPYVAQALVEYYTTINIKKLQELLLKIDVICLDLHQVLSTCRKHKLYSAFIYVTTRALSDFVLPITELVPILNNLLETCNHHNNTQQYCQNDVSKQSNINNINYNQSDNYNTMSNCVEKSNEFISNHLTNNIDFNQLDSLSSGSSILCFNCMESRELGDLLLVYVSGCLGGRKYPSGQLEPKEGDRVKNEVLSILIANHSNISLDGELPYPFLRSLLQYNSREALNVIALAFQESQFKGDVGQLQKMRVVNILLDIVTPETFSNESIGCVLCFIAQQITEKSLPSNETLLDRVMEYLTSPLCNTMSIRQHSERQQAWIDLFNADCLPHMTTAKQMTLARIANCYRVLEELLESCKSYSEIFKCYLLDKQREKQIFHYINTHAENPDRKILKQIEEHIEKLLAISYQCITQIISTHFVSSVDAIAEKIKQKPESMYLFLKGLLENKVKLNAELSELYLELLCENDPNKVESFVKTIDTFRPEQALSITKKFNQKKALAYLLEKQGDYINAFQISFDSFNSMKGNDSDLEEVALEISNLCVRGSKLLSLSEKESLWFPFLESALSRTELRPITRILLHSASSHVHLPALVELILNSGAEGKFGDIKQVLTGMLTNSRYETVLLEATARVLSRDLHQILAKELKKSRKGIAIKSCVCLSCRKSLCSESDCVLYCCGHIFHVNCKPIEEVCPQCGISNIENTQIKENYVYNNQSMDMPNNDFSLKLSCPPRPDLEGIF